MSDKSSRETIIALSITLIVVISTTIITIYSNYYTVRFARETNENALKIANLAIEAQATHLAETERHDRSRYILQKRIDLLGEIFFLLQPHYFLNNQLPNFNDPRDSERRLNEWSGEIFFKSFQLHVIGSKEQQEITGRIIQWAMHTTEQLNLLVKVITEAGARGDKNLQKLLDDFESAEDKMALVKQIEDLSSVTLTSVFEEMTNLAIQLMRSSQVMANEFIGLEHPGRI